MRIAPSLLAIVFFVAIPSASMGSLKKHPTRGIVVASGRMDQNCGRWGHIVFENATGKRSMLLIIDNMFTSRDFEDPPGQFFTQEFEQGEWHIRGLLVGSYLSDFSKLPGYTFTVVAGKALYLGQLHVQPSPDCSSYSIVTTNEWDRDSLLFAKETKELAKDDVEISLLVKD